MSTKIRKAYLRFYLRPGYIKALFAGGDWLLFRRQLRLFWQFMLAR